MKNLMFVAMLFVSVNSFAQINPDFLDETKLDAELIDSLLLDKISKYHKEMFFNKIKNDYVLKMTSRAFNYSVIFDKNIKMSDTFQMSNIILGFYCYRNVNGNIETVFDSSYLDSEFERLLIIGSLIGREKEEKQFVNSKLDILSNSVAHGNLNSNISNISKKVYGGSNFDRCERISIITTIHDIKSYTKIVDIIFNEIINNKYIKNKISKRIGFSCDFKQHKKQIITTIIIEK